MFKCEYEELASVCTQDGELIVIVLRLFLILTPVYVYILVSKASENLFTIL
jgi:hypothetical protein